jgi:hypothetical protein
MLRSRPAIVEATRLTEDNLLELARKVRGWTSHRDGDRGIAWFGRDGSAQFSPIGHWVLNTECNGHVPISDSALFTQYERLVAAVAE